MLGATVDQLLLHQAEPSNDQTPMDIIEEGINNNMHGGSQACEDVAEHSYGALGVDVRSSPKCKRSKLQQEADNCQFESEVGKILGNDAVMEQHLALAVQTRFKNGAVSALDAIHQDAGYSKPVEAATKIHIEYVPYESELQLHDIMQLIEGELSEPYSIYTYRYYLINWPKLCFLAAHKNEYVGVVVGELETEADVTSGYIAMLAVRKDFRRLNIGTNLVTKAIEAMLAANAEEIHLETEVTNLPALRLYESLGFVRGQRMFGYYLNGVDAWNMKLWLK